MAAGLLAVARALRLPRAPAAAPSVLGVVVAVIATAVEAIRGGPLVVLSFAAALVAALAAAFSTALATAGALTIALAFAFAFSLVFAGPVRTLSPSAAVRRRPEDLESSKFWTCRNSGQPKNVGKRSLYEAWSLAESRQVTPARVLTAYRRPDSGRNAHRHAERLEG